MESASLCPSPWRLAFGRLGGRVILSGRGRESIAASSPPACNGTYDPSGWDEYECWKTTVMGVFAFTLPTPRVAAVSPFSQCANNGAPMCNAFEHTAPHPQPRPAGQSFETPFESLTIRSWRPSDRAQAAAVVRRALASYGLGWEPCGADADAVRVEEAYGGARAEFWVVERASDGTIVGTAAFRAADRSPCDTAEIRKMYLAEEVRGRGLGGFLLRALETRILHVGYDIALVETASVLVQAVALYRQRGYTLASGVDTLRCDMVLTKRLRHTDALGAPECNGEQVIVVDRLGCAFTEVLRSKARKRRLLYQAVATLVLSQDGTQAFVQRRSWKKYNYPGVLDLFVAGGLQAGETCLAAAHRELSEELGLDPSWFKWDSLWDGVHIVDGTFGDRCVFRGFVARAQRTISPNDVRFVDEEVDEGFFMNREDVDKEDLPSPIWAHVQALEARPDCPLARVF